MAMFSNFPGSNWKRTNVQLVSLACGLALATVALVGGNEILRDKGNSGTVSPVRVAQPAGSAFDPTDFGSQGIEYKLAQQAARDDAAAALQDARGIGQAGEGTSSAAAIFIDETDFGSLGIESVINSVSGGVTGENFGSVYLPYMQDGVVTSNENGSTHSPAAPLFGTMVDGVYVIEGDIQLP